MEAIDKVKAARAALKEAEGTLRTEAKGVIEDLLEGLFKNNPDIEKIEFAQKSSEYNDEGMYPGIFGPVINDPSEEIYEADWLYGWSDNPKTEARLEPLKEAINSVGEDILSEIYGDECVVTVTRSPAKNCPTCKQPVAQGEGFVIKTEYAGV